MKVPFNKPTLPPYELVSNDFTSFYETGLITNHSMVHRLEQETEKGLLIGNSIGLSSCTSGLILALRCLEICGKVALPSFTFYASAHAVLWNNLEPVLADIDPSTWTLSFANLDTALDEDDEINAVLPVHVFGNPCDVEAIDSLARERGLKVLYDAAHAMGSKVGDLFVGSFGDAEVFSLSPTKMVVAGEGGLVTTGDAGLAEKLVAARDYGNAGDYDPEIVGLNARMSEFHAALALESFKMLEQNVTRRNEIAAKYIEGLSVLPGITFQKIKSGNRSNYKDFTILVDEEQFGLNRDALSWHLGREGIDTRKYYYPPVHRTKAYWEKYGRKYDERLPVTNRISEQALSLPIWSHMELEIVDTVVDAINIAHKNADEIGAEFRKSSP